MARVIVIGGGIAGVACARRLIEGGADTTLLDRGRELGGRLGGRRIDDRPVDLGASYFTVSTPEFGSVVTDWRARGLARPWTDTFAVRRGPDLSDPSIPDAAGDRATTTGAMRWAAPAGLRGLVVDLAAGLPVERGTAVAGVRRDGSGWSVDGRRCDVVVLAMPDPQARRLLAPGPAAEVLDDPYAPVLALATTWPRRRWDWDGVFVNGDEVLSFVADDGSRRGDRASVLVAHSTEGFAAGRLADPDRAIGPMVARLRRVAGLPAGFDPITVHLHRWSFAKPTRPRPAPYLLTSDGLGVCGDAWSERSRVEAAYLSGLRLAEAIAG